MNEIDMMRDMAGGMGLGIANASGTVMILGLVWGLFGFSYFVYGKKQGNMIALLAGIGLMLFPYFVSTEWESITIGLLLLVSPFTLGKFL